MPAMPLTPPPSVPALELAAGLRVVRRGLDRVQVGLHDRPVVLERSAPTQRALAHLLEHRPLAADDREALSVLDRLRERGCAVPSPEAATTTRLRGRAVVSVQDQAGVAELGGVDPRALLRAAGVGRVGAGWSVADVVLVLWGGEVPREELDPLVRRGVAHLVVRLVDGGAVLGPFVVPGTSPCLRCLDAHLAVGDPHRVAVTARYVRATALPRADGRRDVEDPALVVEAVAWAVRDVVAHLDGHRPSTWASTVRLAPAAGVPEALTWTLHPDCGCCWPVLVA